MPEENKINPTPRLALLRAASLAVSAALLVAACSSGDMPVVRPDPFAGYEIVDLSHPFDEQTVYWPTGRPFRHDRTAWGPQPGGFWYSAFDLAMSEHTGTHLDAPVHFAEGGAAVGQLSLADLSGPVAVVDVSQQCEDDPDYAASVDDLDAHEDRHGQISEGMIVVFRTGWSRRWPDTLSYLGDDTPGRADRLRFPGISSEAAKRLAERGVAVVGIDTASIDPGTSSDFASHQVLAGDSIPALENLTQLDLLPERGAHLLAFPMKIATGSGAPCRVAALVPQN
ncbi:MAG: cyclase family protein [Bryobacterales bacterium]|nr:cyclase family protein [Bryobacterales bacterium]